MFENNLGVVPDEIAKRYRELKDPKHVEPGKTKKANAIINSYVPRTVGFKGSLVPKKATIERVMSRESRAIDTTAQIGYEELVCIGKVFGGNRGLFEEAKQKGQVYENNGKWYYDAHRHADEERKYNKASGLLVSEIDGSKFLQAMSAIMEQFDESKHSKWIDDVEKKSTASSSAQPSGKANDNDYRILQESFDSVTRVTNAIRQVAMAMTKDAPSSTASSMALRGVQLCKEVIPSQDRVEALLMSIRDNVSGDDIRTALAAAAVPYRALVGFYNELLVLYKHNVSQAAVGTPVLKMKPLTL